VTVPGLSELAIFFFSSRRRHTRSKRDWSSDVCSSDLIPENTTTAIVGPSGSGKTTICNLLARFYDVDNGCIKIGGVKISDMKCDSLLANITMVFQNVYLFRDSIANNIKFGKPDATKQEVIEAAKKACCYDFIISLPDGFDTVIGD